MKTKGEKEFVRICPKCGSSDISDDLSNPSIKFIGHIENMVCNECGFTGTIFPEQELSDRKNDSKE